MSKFFENIKSGINEKKTNHKFSKSLKRLRAMELSTAYSAHRLVLAEVKETVPGAGISAEASGVPKHEFMKACEEVIAGYWESENYSPEGMTGSIAAQFNFFLIRIICKIDEPVDAEKFLLTLDWAIAQGGLEDFEIWCKEAKDGKEANLFPETITRYAKKHLPRVLIELRIKQVEAKLAKLAELKASNKSSKSVVYFIDGLRKSTISGTKNYPSANLSRFIEYYNPELMDKTYIAPFFGIHRSLKPDANQFNDNFLFCKEGIIVTPDSNYGAPCTWVARNKIKKIVCGYAYDALVTDGVTKYENHKIYMILKYSNGEQGVGYQYIGSNREQAISQIDATQDRIEILSDSYNIEWSDEVIDESSHYKTTTTTTTTYFAWN
jgi:hypothetical protein